MTLRNRLARIYGEVKPSDNASSGAPETPHSTADLSSFLKGQWDHTNQHQLLVVDRNYPLHYRNGTIRLEQLHDVTPTTLAWIANDASFKEFEPERTLFLDTETTGLAGGTGTYVFLVGVGFFRKGSFHIRQLFLPKLEAERAFLQGLVDLVEKGMDGRRFRYLVSFNGKSYDLNLLEMRLILKGVQTPFRDLAHLDVLHPARMLWKNSFDSCSLQSLESGVLGLRRKGDIPSSQIPGIYFDYLRQGSCQSFQAIFEHNRQDLLSLVSLLSILPRALTGRQPPPGVPLLAAARLLELRKQFTAAAQLLSDALQTNNPEARSPEAMIKLAQLHRKLGSHQKALTLLDGVIESEIRPSLQAFVEAAKILEHRLKDLEGSARRVAQGLRYYPHSFDLQRRRLRLISRLQGKRWY